MSRTTIRGVMAAMAVCFTAVTATAQTTTTSTQTKKFEVITVSGSNLVVTLPEGTRESWCRMISASPSMASSWPHAT